MQKHILLVDDSITIREALRKVLEKVGHSVKEADDGLRALPVTQQMSFNLIITDINMPEMDGLSFVEAVRSDSSNRNKNTPVVVLSTENSAIMKTRAKKLGVKGWATKPVSESKLLEILQALKI